MFVSPNYVHQGHHSPYIPNPLPPALPNGHAYPAHITNGNTAQNGHVQHQNPPPQAPSHRPPQQPLSKEPINVVGIPSVSVQTDRLIVGDSQSSSTRSYTPLKVLGDGSFGTVLLCDWHGTLPPNTPLSPMQCGAGARPEWAGKRLVAIKIMKKKWEGGWDECKKLKELESLQAIAFHPNIIPLYDFFLLPGSKELYFVFESMEGNLYHLIKTRKGRPLAGGLVSSIFRQIVAGLDHIHASGYFHRDMKPENVLVTTTGLFDYQSVSPIARPDAPPEGDVVAIIKLADFGLARETKSKPPYTEYVSTRWYRAPEVLLLSRDYSNPVDMWALGTIMAELVNLRPLFPGAGQIDQVARICEILGDPSDDYGVDARGKPIGGGKWSRGIKMARAVGFAFPKVQPKDIFSLFEPSVPRSLIECIADLLRYDPALRLTSRQCLSHQYLRETLPKNNIPLPPGIRTGSPPVIPPKSPLRNGIKSSASLPSVLTQGPHPGQLHHPIPKSAHLHRPLPIPDGVTSHRTPFFPPSINPPLPNGLPNGHGPHPSSSLQPNRREHVAHGTNGVASPRTTELDAMEVSSPLLEHHDESPAGIQPQPMDIQSSPTLQDYPAPPHEMQNAPPGQETAQAHPNKTAKLPSLAFGKKPTKWGLAMFSGGDKGNHLPPVDEIPVVSLKRTQSSSTDSSEVSPLQEPPMDPKLAKKEAERLKKDAEKQKRALAEKTHRDQARAVMQKRKQMQHGRANLEWAYLRGISPASGNPRQPNTSGKAKASATGPIRGQSQKGVMSTTTLDAAAGHFTQQSGTQQSELPTTGDWRGKGRLNKARRREWDDDHSMSSSDLQSPRISMISFATGDSDPGPSGLRTRRSLFDMSRVTSTSSFRTSLEDFPTSARSSNSVSLEHQFAHDFSAQSPLNPSTPISGSVSPPPMQLLSLSPSLSPSPTWTQLQPSRDNSSISSSRGNSNYLSMQPSQTSASGTHGSYESSGLPYRRSSSPGSRPLINPIFLVPPLTSLTPPADEKTSPLSLPPCSHLEAVADREYPPESPMSFHQQELS